MRRARPGGQGAPAAPLAAPGGAGRPGGAAAVRAGDGPAQPQRHDHPRARHARPAVVRGHPRPAVRGPAARRGRRLHAAGPDRELPPGARAVVLLPGGFLPDEPGALRPRRRRGVRPGPRPGHCELGVPARRGERLHLRADRRGTRLRRLRPGDRALRGCGGGGGPAGGRDVHRAGGRAGGDQHRVRRRPAAGHGGHAAARLVRRFVVAGHDGRVRPAGQLRPPRARAGWRSHCRKRTISSAAVRSSTGANRPAGSISA